MMRKTDYKPKRVWQRLAAAAMIFCLTLELPCMDILPKAAETVSDNSADGTVHMESGGDVSQNGGVFTDMQPKEAGGAPANPFHYCVKEYEDGDDTTEWSYVYFGVYPQSEVTDETVKAAVDAAIGQGKGKSAGTETDSEGIDVWVGSVRYRRISRQDCNKGNITNFGSSRYRYFKWERIKWRVLQSEGNMLFLAADMAVDCKNYDDATVSREWKECTIRQWLGDTFYQNAFSSEEKGVIVPQDVLSQDDPDYEPEIGVDEPDKVYLLSLTEATNPEYGFCSDSYVRSGSRMFPASAYAYARGTGRSAEEGNCRWWLRTLGGTKGNVKYGSDEGHISDTNGNNKSHGIVPVICIKHAPAFWSMVDDGSSGEREDDEIKGTDNTGSKVLGISITGISGKIAAGKKIKLEAKVLPADAADKTVTWSSSNPGYAAVDADGLVRVSKAGAGKTVVITATAKDGFGVCAEYKIKIMKHAVKKVKITASSKSVKAGKKLKLKAAVTATGKNANKKLKWTSSNENYATVSSGGVVKASKAGKGKTVTITAEATDGSGKKAKVRIKIK